MGKWCAYFPVGPHSPLAVGLKTAIITWTDNTKSTSDKVKLALTQLVTPKLYDSNCDLQLTTDASDFALGAVIQQIRNGFPEPLEFFSMTLNSTQKNYSTFDRELLAIQALS